MSQSSASLIEYQTGPNTYTTLQALLNSIGAGSSLAGAPLSNRNYIVDGNFDCWNQTTGTVAATAYVNSVSPMFYCTAGTGGAGTINQGTFALGSIPVNMTTPVPHYLQYVQTTAGTSATPAIVQRIEYVRTLAGQSATFSCWLWTASGTITIPSIVANQNFGSGGSPSTAVSTSKAVNWVVTTTPTRFSVRLDFPSIAGLTIGTSSTDFVALQLTLPLNQTFTVNKAQWQLEQSSPQSSSDINGNGGLPTAFEYRGIGPELARVQRYYYTTYMDVTNVGSATTIGQGFFYISAGSGALFNGASITFNYPVTMRPAPVVTSYSPATGTPSKMRDQVNVVDITGSVSASGPNGCCITGIMGTAQNYVNLAAHIVADARL